MNCENRPTPKRGATSAQTAPGASGKDGGVDARPIATPRRSAHPLRPNNAAVQGVNRDGGSLHEDAVVLLPTISFNRYQFRESSRPVSALGCYVVDFGVQVFAELANAYVNRRIRQCVTS